MRPVWYDLALIRAGKVRAGKGRIKHVVLLDRLDSIASTAAGGRFYLLFSFRRRHLSGCSETKRLGFHVRPALAAGGQRRTVRVSTEAPSPRGDTLAPPENPTSVRRPAAS
jgi:hypothetical protein